MNCSLNVCVSRHAAGIRFHVGLFTGDLDDSLLGKSLV
jgi:hypothetical protein